MSDYRAVSQDTTEERGLPEHDWERHETTTGDPYWRCTRCSTRVLTTTKPRPGQCWGRKKYLKRVNPEERS